MCTLSLRHGFGLGLALLWVSILCACEEKKQRAVLPPQARFMRLAGKQASIICEPPGRVSAFTASTVRPQASGITKFCRFEEGADMAIRQDVYLIEPELVPARFCLSRPLASSEPCGVYSCATSTTTCSSR